MSRPLSNRLKKPEKINRKTLVAAGTLLMILSVGMLIYREVVAPLMLATD